MDHNVVVPHPPAMKVGGRRLSISTRQRRNSTTDSGNPETKTDDDIKADYPRPTAPSGTEVLHQDRQEEEPPKKEYKQVHELEKRMYEYTYWKGTTPTRDPHGNIRGPTMGMRIRQPGGKMLGV
jgi:hypothetical protein